MLIEAGHHYARQYPIGMLLDEAEIVDQRFNYRMAANAALHQLAVSSTPSEFNKSGVKFAKQNAKAFAERLKALQGE